MISIHAPLAGSDPAAYHQEPSPSISIHAPLAGSDTYRTQILGSLVNFNPRSPRGERPLITERIKREMEISIHAPLAGSDRALMTCILMTSDFNPRSPRGERRSCGHLILSCKRFQSTLPSRGATRLIEDLNTNIAISIHAPLAGSDADRAPHTRPYTTFQSTLPSRGATTG